MENLIIGLIIICILALAIAYIIRAKKRGVKCIGCSCSSGCSGNCSSCSTQSNKYDEILDFELPKDEE